MSEAGAKIIEGLKHAIAGNFVRVTIDGQTWIRRDEENAQIAVMKDALDFILSLAEEEYEHCKVGTGAEVALRHIIRKSREAVAKATGQSGVAAE
jgi:hypothetical protein